MPAQTLNIAYIKKFRKDIAALLPQSKGILEITLSYAAIAFFGWFAIRPTLVTITGLFNEINTQRTVLEQLDNKINALVAADTTYRSAQHQLKLLDQALPKHHQSPEFMSQIEILALENNVNIITLNFSEFKLKPQQETPLKTSSSSQTSTNRKQTTNNEEQEIKNLSFQINLHGSYSDLRHFLTQLANIRRVVTVDNLSFRPNNNLGFNSIIMQINGNALYL